MYTLKSVSKWEKYKGKTIQQCIDENTFAWKNIINKNPQYYTKDVHEYLKESLSLIGNYKTDIKFNDWINRKNT